MDSSSHLIIEREGESGDKMCPNDISLSLTFSRSLRVGAADCIGLSE